jgi:hypothetical protein
MLFKYGRQSIPSLSNNFLYNELPTFMLQMKTGGAGSGGQGGMGTSLAAFYRFFVQGVMTKGALQSMQEIGLINKGAGLHTTTTGTQLMSGQHVKGLGLAQSDPFLWVQNYMLPAIRKKYGNDLSNQQTTYAIGQAMKGASQTGIFAVQQFAIKAQQVYRDEAIIQRAKDVNQAYSMALSNDPNTAMSALSAQWKNTETAFAMTVIPILIPALISLTRNLNDLSITMRKFPKITSEVAKGLFYLFTAMTGVGAVTIVGSIFAKFFLMFKPLRIMLLGLIFPITEIVIAMGVMGAGLFKLLSYLNGFIALFTTHKGFIRDVEAFNSAIGRQDLNEKYQKGLIIPNKSSDTVIHSHLYLNGDEIAKSVTKSQAKKMTNQPNHGSVINGSMFLSPNMANAYAIGHQS